MTKQWYTIVLMIQEHKSIHFNMRIWLIELVGLKQKP